MIRISGKAASPSHHMLSKSVLGTWQFASRHEADWALGQGHVLDCDTSLITPGIRAKQPEREEHVRERRIVPGVSGRRGKP